MSTLSTLFTHHLACRVTLVVVTCREPLRKLRIKPYRRRPLEIRSNSGHLTLPRLAIYTRHEAHRSRLPSRQTNLRESAAPSFIRSRFAYKATERHPMCQLSSCSALSVSVIAATHVARLQRIHPTTTSRSSSHCTSSAIFLQSSTMPANRSCSSSLKIVRVLSVLLVALVQTIRNAELALAPVQQLRNTTDVEPTLPRNAVHAKSPQSLCSSLQVGCFLRLEVVRRASRVSSALVAYTGTAVPSFGQVRHIRHAGVERDGLEPG